MDATELIAIGKIERTFGVKGEVKVRSLSDAPGRFGELARVTVERGDGVRVDASVEQVRKLNGAYYLLKFRGIETPEEASAWRGALLKIPRDQAPALPPGSFYEFELLGTTVVDEGGLVLGVLEEILETPGHHVLVVRSPGQEHLLPATKEVVRSVDVDARTVTVRWANALTEAADAL